MSTQLRLISRYELAEHSSGGGGVAPPVPPREGSRAGSPSTATGSGGRAGRATGRSAARRVIHRQAQWRLDDRTREVGRAGVASAREALARAHPDRDLRRAS
ncbi:MAG: hypothetical protein ACKOA9_01010 [Actinomycetota bacterium]